MTSDSPLSPPLVPSAVRREEIVQALCAHFANDHLSVEDLEARLDRVYKAESLAELDAVLADLPAIGGAAPAGEGLQTGVPEVPGRGMIMAVLSGARRHGRWVVPRHLRVVAFLGGAHLDLRDAVLAPGVTEIEVFAFMGGVEITVPAGVRLESIGTAFMGGIDIGAGAGGAGSGPVVRVSGFVLMGGVDAKQALPEGAVLDRFRTATELAQRHAARRLRR